MDFGTVKKSVLASLFCILGISVNTFAQEKPAIEEDFVFFIDGANVSIPILDGTVENDPLDVNSENRVFQIPYGGWAESGFRWPNGDRDSSGVDLSSFIGASYGESDTLYIRILADPANRTFGSGATYLAFFDTDTGINYDTDNLPFRARWQLPDSVLDGNWHNLAIPLPPRTLASLENAKVGLDSAGNALTLPVDDTLDLWNYGGAWANPGPGGGEGLIVSPGDPKFEDFDWESIKYVGIHFDHNNGGGPIYFDYASIGVPPEELSDVSSDPVTSVQVSNIEGINTIEWDPVGNASAYIIYFSEQPITNVLDNEVVLIGKKALGETLTIEHEAIAPHESLGKDFSSYYAVTTSSFFGKESDPVQESIISDLNVNPNYAAEISVDNLNAIYGAINDYDNQNPSIGLTSEDLASFFPDGYHPFQINNDRKFIENGSGGDNDTDISGKAWIGFSSQENRILIYSEIEDDVLETAYSSIGAGSGWAYDSWEFGIGNYQPSSFIISSTHQIYERGAEPDYQFRAGLFSDRTPYIYVTHGDSEVPNSATIGEQTPSGYRLLTLINTNALLSLNGNESDAPFSFPSLGDVKTYPINWALNDADGATRETQISWSNRAGGDTWWNNPSKLQTIAFVGAFENNSETISIAEALEQPTGSTASIKGVVTRAWDNFLFLQQDTAAINTYMTNGFYRDAIVNDQIQAGDSLIVTGNIAEFEGLIFLENISNFELISEDNPLPEPIELSLSEIYNSGTKYHSELIRVDSLTIPAVIEFMGGTNYEVYESGDAPLSINMFVRNSNGSEIGGGGYQVPQLFTYEGVLGYYDPENTGLGHQFTPTYSGDIIEIEPPLSYPTPPYALGDTANFNGSFALSALGSTPGTLGWFFNNINSIGVLDIVEDAQDGDNRALRVGITFDGNTENDWHIEAVNEPFYVTAGETYRASVYMKADSDQRVGVIGFGLPEAGGYERVKTTVAQLTEEWQEVSVTYTATEFDEANGMRFIIPFNLVENDGGTVWIDNLQIIRTEYIPPSLSTISEARDVSEGNEVTIKGAVTRTTYNFVYLQEENAGIMVYSSPSSSIEFFNALQNGEILQGDSLMLTGMREEYQGLSELAQISIFEVTSSGNALPEPQLISLEEAMTNGEAYESELVRIENIKPMFTNISVPPNEAFYLHSLDETQSGVLYAHAPANSEWANHGIHPLNTFNYEGILKQVDAGSGPEYVLAPHDEGDIIPVDEVDFSDSIANESGFEELNIGLASEYGFWDLASSSNASFEVVDSESFEGDKSLKATLNNNFTVGSDGLGIFPKEPVSLVPGEAYKISVWMKMEAGIGRVFVALGGDFPNGDGTHFNVYEEWNKFEIIAIAGNSGFGNPSFHFDLEENIGKTIFVDKIEVLGPAQTNQPIFSVNPIGGIIGDTVSYSLFVDIESEALEAFEFSMTFNTELIEVLIPNQLGTIGENFEVLTNFIEPEKLLVSGATVNAVTESGVLFTLDFVLKAGGEGIIELDNIFSNEEEQNSLKSDLLVIERYCGDVTNDKTIGTLDATYVLRHTVLLSPQYPLTGLDSLAADVTANGNISAFDASKILQYEVGIISSLGCQTAYGKIEPQIAKADWKFVENKTNLDVLEVDFASSDFDIYSAQFEIELGEGVSYKGIKNLPEDWNLVSNQTDGKLHISLFGITQMEEKKLEIQIDPVRTSSILKFNASLILNESESLNLNEITLSPVIPSEFKLDQNYPNPFNPSTQIKYSLPENGLVNLSVFNMLGQKVAELVNTSQDAGSYEVTWDAGTFSSGVYIYRLTTGSSSITKRMMLIK